MPFFSFNSSKKTTLSPRWFAGISITSNCRRIESAVIGVHGRGSGAPVEIRKTISFDLPRDIIDSYHELWDAVYPNSTDARFAPASSEAGIPAALFQHVLRELASVEEEAIDELIAESRLARNDVLAVGIHDPGFFCSLPTGTHYMSLCDAAYLAEQTGMNIVDAFSTQDVASGGRGGPLFPMPLWIFLKSELQNRILIDLGRTATLTFLPRADTPFAHHRIAQHDVVPCGSLLDALTWELTGGKASVDTGGKIAVQGCQIPELLSELRSVTAQQGGWSPFGLSPERFLRAATQSGGTAHSYQDRLCTASCFIAESVAENLLSLMAEHDREEEAEPEILVCGACRMHGMIMNQISSHLHQRKMIPISQLDIPPDTFDALCTGMMTVMATDHIPAGLPHLTGSEASKTLGRITPGSVGNWTRLLREMAATNPAARSLRSAM